MAARITAVAVIALSGCTTFTLTGLRQTYPVGEQLEAFCASYPPTSARVNDEMGKTYAAGWRIAAIGSTQTSFFGFTVKTEPVVCYERPRPPPTAPVRKALPIRAADQPGDELLDPPPKK